MAIRLSNADLELLDPEEREAFLKGETPEPVKDMPDHRIPENSQGQAEQKEPTGQPPKSNGYGDDEESDWIEAEQPEPEGEEGGAEPEPDEAEPDEAEPDEAEQPPQTIPDPPDPAVARSAQEALDAAKAKRSEALKQYEEGDIDDEEFARLDEQAVQEMVDSQVALKAAQEQNRQREEALDQQWQQSVASFRKMGDGPTLAMSGERLGAFQKEIERVFEDNPTAGFDAALRAAYERMRSTDNALPELGAAKAKGKPRGKGGPAPTTPPGQRDVPQTLGDVPSAGGDINSQFAGVDELDGLDYEDAVAKMTAAQRKAFLAGEG